MAGKTDTPPKKYRSTFFRVAIESASTGGRTIERHWLAGGLPTLEDYRRDQRWAFRDFLGNSRTTVALL